MRTRDRVQAWDAGEHAEERRRGPPLGVPPLLHEDSGVGVCRLCPASSWLDATDGRSAGEIFLQMFDLMIVPYVILSLQSCHTPLDTGLSAHSLPPSAVAGFGEGQKGGK